MSRCKKTHCFEIYPSDEEDGELFFFVSVHPNRQSMLRKYRKLSHGVKAQHNFGAVVMERQIENFEKGKRDVQPVLGFVLFERSYLGGAVVTHEAVHMATTYLRRVRKSLRLNVNDIDIEEQLAHYVERCAAKISAKLFELRIWK
jgi:hypothetical protein